MNFTLGYQKLMLFFYDWSCVCCAWLWIVNLGFTLGSFINSIKILERKRLTKIWFETAHQQYFVQSKFKIKLQRVSYFENTCQENFVASVIKDDISRFLFRNVTSWVFILERCHFKIYFEIWQFEVAFFVRDKMLNKSFFAFN